MSFVTIGLLVAGATSVSVPILIHLLSRHRRRPIEWAAMRFLIEALRKYRWRVQMEQLLLLAVRCLILLVLGAALARPILNAAGIGSTGGLRVVPLIIANGLTSAARVEVGGELTSELTESIAQAVELVGSLGPGDLVGLVTAARPARGLLVPPSADHSAVIELMESIEPAESPTDLPGALGVVQSVLKELRPDRDHTLAYLFSGFRRGAASLEVPLPGVLVDVAEQTTLLASPPAKVPIPNIQVAGLTPLRGLVLAQGGRGQTSGAQITVSLARFGAPLDRGVTRVRLVGKDLGHVEPKVIQWEPGQQETRVDFMLSLSGRGERALPVTAVIEEDALGADNQRHIVLAAREKVRVLLVDRRSFGAEPGIEQLGAGAWIRRALVPTDQSPMDVIEVDPAALEPIDLRAADGAVLVRPDLLAEEGWLVLRKYVDGGGLLLVVPPGQSNIHQWTDRLSETFALPWHIELEVVEPAEGLALAPKQPASELLRLLSGELEGLTRPVLAYRVLPVDGKRTQAQRILNFADGSALLIAGSPREIDADPDTANVPRGLVLYLAVSPELSWSNLPAKPLMVPLFHELLRQGIGMIRTSRLFSVGQQPRLGLGPAAATLMGPDGRRLPIDATGRAREPLGRAGVWKVLDQADQTVGAVAVNVEPDAGRTDTQPQAAVTQWLRTSGPWEAFDPADPAAALRTAQTGSPLAGLLLLVVAALVALETALARLFSHATRPARQRFATGVVPQVAGGAAPIGGG